MKKILVFVCLMFISISSSALLEGYYSVDDYKKMRKLADEEEFISMLLEHHIYGTYYGLFTVVKGSQIGTEEYGTRSNIKLFCVPDNLTLNEKDLYAIIDDEIQRSNPPDALFVAAVLYAGLTETFPCE